MATQLLLIGELFPFVQIHFVGHSLGGQLGGYVGREVISQSSGNKKLKRLQASLPSSDTLTESVILIKFFLFEDSQR